MRFSILVFFVFLGFLSFGQSRPTGDWIDYGSGHINKWLQIAPNKLGPNALPVPFMDYGLLDSLSNIETGVHGHFMKGDRAINSYLSLYWAVVPKRVVVHVWGFPTETFRTHNSVRDDRQIYYDDNGWMTKIGDMWISTYIQILKEKKNWPDITINYSAKTTIGDAVQGRYTDAPANYYYAAFGKSIFPKNSFIDEIRLGCMLGFYVWQTNKVELAQDEGVLYEIGVDIKHKNLSWRNEFGGYSGYGGYQYIGVDDNNDPLIYRTNFKSAGERFDWKLEFQTGFRDYDYQTIRMSVFYKFGFGFTKKWEY
jgi:hypothetical protein